MWIFTQTSAYEKDERGDGTEYRIGCEKDNFSDDKLTTDLYG